VSDPLLNEYSGLLAAVAKLQDDVARLNRIAAAIPGVASLASRFIEEQTASASATLDFVLPSGYRAYQLVIRNLKPATDAVNLWLRVSTDNGATFLTSATYSYHSQGSNSGIATYNANNANGAAQILLNGLACGNAADEATSGLVEIWNADSAVNKKAFTYHLVIANVNGDPGHNSGAGDNDTTGAINAVRIMFSSGNIASGTVALYGVV